MGKQKFTLEVCIDSLESAVAAKNGGADRLEFCGELLIGGVTPSVHLVRQVQEAMDLPLRCMVRPRFGDFLYTDSEFEIMKKNVEEFRLLGVSGVVLGILTPDGRLDKPRMAALIDLAGSMDIVLHRAFDMTINPMEALEDARALGVDTILTSGQAPTAYQGRALIAELIRHSGGIEILPGAGVSLETLPALRAETGATSFHLSGKKKRESKMKYRNPKVSMGLPGMSEYQRWVTDQATVARVRQLIDRME